MAPPPLKYYVLHTQFNGDNYGCSLSDSLMAPKENRIKRAGFNKFSPICAVKILQDFTLVSVMFVYLHSILHPFITSW